MDWSGLPDQGTATPSIDFSGLPDQAPQSPANAPGTPDLASFGAQAAQYAPDGLTPENEAGLEQQFSQEHPYIYGVAKGITGMVPRSLDDLKRMATLPMPSHDVEQEQAANAQLGAQWRGEYGPTQQAASITGTVLQALPLLGLASGESPFRATPNDAALVEQFRQAQAQAAERPPVQPEAPPAWASDPIVPAPSESLKSETAAVDLSKLPDQVENSPETATVQDLPQNPQPETKKTRLDLILDGVEKHGEVNLAIGGEISRERVRQVEDAASARGMTAAYDGHGFLIRKNPTADTGAIPAPQENLQPEQPSVTIPPEDAKYAGTSPASEWENKTWDELTHEQRALAEDKYAKDTGDEPRFAKVADWYVSRNTGEVSPSTEEIFQATRNVKYAGTSPEFQARNAKAGQSDAPSVQPASVGSSGVDRAGVPERPDTSGTSTKNAYTDAAREKYGLAPAVQEARKSLGQSLVEAQRVESSQPGAARRLVDDINAGRVKAIDDKGDGLLTIETIDAQVERASAEDAVNKASTPDELDAAKARLQAAKDRQQAAYDADKLAGTHTARGLNARQMVAKNDYSLTRMEGAARAAQNGKPLSGKQSTYIQDLQKRIDTLEKQATQYHAGKARPMAERKKFKSDAVTANRSGKSMGDFLSEKANAARERIRQMEKAGVDCI